MSVEQPTLGLREEPTNVEDYEFEPIKGYPMLEGVRGEAGSDLAAIEEILLRASRLAADFPEIVEMDLNPIFAYGSGASAVDVRVRVK